MEADHSSAEGRGELERADAHRGKDGRKGGEGTQEVRCHSDGVSALHADTRTDAGKTDGEEPSRLSLDRKGAGQSDTGEKSPDAGKAVCARVGCCHDGLAVYLFPNAGADDGGCVRGCLRSIGLTRIRGFVQSVVKLEAGL